MDKSNYLPFVARQTLMSVGLDLNDVSSSLVTRAIIFQEM